jgi:hypothetical protein
VALPRHSTVDVRATNPGTAVRANPCVSVGISSMPSHSATSEITNNEKYPGRLNSTWRMPQATNARIAANSNR